MPARSVRSVAPAPRHPVRPDSGGHRGPVVRNLQTAPSGPAVGLSTVCVCRCPPPAARTTARCCSNNAAATRCCPDHSRVLATRSPRRAPSLTSPVQATRMVPLGVLDAKDAVFAVPPAALAQGYRIVDLSRGLRQRATPLGRQHHARNPARLTRAGTRHDDPHLRHDVGLLDSRMESGSAPPRTAEVAGWAGSGAAHPRGQLHGAAEHARPTRRGDHPGRRGPAG